MIRYTAEREEDLEGIAREILERFSGRRVFLFYGDLGAGKTTFIKRFCQLLAVEDTVQSPTFSIVNEYRTREGGMVYHMDFYRMESAREVADIGLEEYLYSGRYCFIEWPEKAGYVPEEAVIIKIEVRPGGEREINVQEGLDGQFDN
jgi:tRNA threonylcarbamoyladenosine biosynthesis protein TsaE